MKTMKWTRLGLTHVGAFGLIAAASALAPASHAQAVRTFCTAGGFDVCFPNLDMGAPNDCGIGSSSAAEVGDAGPASDAGVATEGAEDELAITACLSRVCRNEASEPSAGFFEYCCAAGGAEHYDEYCIWMVQSECSAVAESCADRCPPLELMMGTVTLAPPPADCLDTYPPFIGSVCAADPFCCETSWDSLCAGEALAASLLP